MIKKIVSFLCIVLTSSTSIAQTVNQYRIDNSEHSFAINNKQPVQRAAAYAPNIISKCSGAAAAGAQGQFAGISFAGSYKDEFCERAELIKLCIAMGHDDLADQLLYEFPMVKDLEDEASKEICDYPTKCTRLGR